MMHICVTPLDQRNIFALDLAPDCNLHLQNLCWFLADFFYSFLLGLNIFLRGALMKEFEARGLSILSGKM